MKPYTKEITADVDGLPITNPRDVVEALFKNDTWGAGETETFVKEGAALDDYKFEGAINRASLRSIIEEFALFRKKDGIYFQAF